MLTKSDYQSFVGMSGFYRKHIKYYASLAKPLYDYVKEKGTAKELLKIAIIVVAKLKKILKVCFSFLFGV